MKYYVINLDRRTDRLESFQVMMDSHKLEFVRIPAVDGQVWTVTDWKKQGRAKESYWRGAGACRASHLQTLKIAINANEFPCCVLEDDCVLEQIPNVADNSGMVLLGGEVLKSGIYGTHAIMYCDLQSCLKWFCYLSCHKNTVDSVCNMYRKLGNVKVFSKGFITYQRSDYSDIIGEVRSESWTKISPKVE